MKAFGIILAWVLTVVLAIVFTFAGGVKLIGKPAMVQEFARSASGNGFVISPVLLKSAARSGDLSRDTDFGLPFKLRPSWRARQS